MTTSEHKRPETAVATAAGRYLDEVHPDWVDRPRSSSRSEQIQEAERNVCESLSRLLQELLENVGTWDSRCAAIDGIWVAEFDRAGPRSITIQGAAYVLVGGKTLMEPVQARITLDATGVRLADYEIRFGDSRSNGIEYSRFSVKKLRIPSQARNWKYTFRGPNDAND